MSLRYLLYYVLLAFWIFRYFLGNSVNTSTLIIFQTNAQSTNKRQTTGIDASARDYAV